MRIPDEVRKCVVFLGLVGEKGFSLAGTAFYLGIALEERPELSAYYLVTARHVLTKIWENSKDRKVYIRINLANGGATDLVTDFRDWDFASSDEPIPDVCYLRGAPDPAIFDYQVLPMPWVVTDELIRSSNIGIGDEVFITGLFANHFGRARNIPIVRIGAIAAMPEEPVETTLGDMDAYLVEARSTGGLSGAPAFLHFGGVREQPETGKYWLMEKAQYRLLGLVHGHYQVSTVPSEIDRDAVNMGIAIVVPSQTILTVLNNPEEIKKRRRIKEGEIAKPPSNS